MSVDRHLRIALLACLPLIAIVGSAFGHWEWNETLMWIIFGVITVMGMAIVYRGVPKLPREN